MPDWLWDFLPHSPFYECGNFMWNLFMKLSMGLLSISPNDYSESTWSYVMDDLYPWALAIGILELNMFVMIGFLRTVTNLRDRLTLEAMIEVIIKIVILNVLLIKGPTIIENLFSMASAMAGGVINIETPAAWTEDCDIGSLLFDWLIGFFYMLCAIICGFQIMLALYQRYIKLYMLVVTFPLAVPSITGGRGVEGTAYAWIRNFISCTFEVVVIALAMGITGKLIAGVSILEAESFVGSGFDGFLQGFNTMIQMILMAVSVKGASSFMNKTFHL